MGTFWVLLFLVGVVTNIILRMHKQKKAGKCVTCSCASSCHKASQCEIK